MVLLPGARAITPARHDRMPYRVFFAQIGERLRLTYDGRANGYQNLRQFRADVRLVATSLQANKGANAGLFYVQRLLRRIDTFGFHLATLDVRQHASVLHDVVARGLDDSEWLMRSSAERRRLLGRCAGKGSRARASSWMRSENALSRCSTQSCRAVTATAPPRSAIS